MPATPSQLRVLPQARSSTLVVEECLFMKVLRQVGPGIHVEAEMGRFLTDVAHFEHHAAVAGTVEHVADGGATSSLILLQADAGEVIAALSRP